MADHSKPTTASTYTNFVTELDGRFDDLVAGLDPAYVTATNVPTNSLRFSSAAAKWQRWNGSSWVDPVATYAISISGNAGSVTNGVYTNGAYADPAWITSLAGSKITGNISGNAGTATTLATARTINGVSFNGSANISVNTNNSVTFNNGGSGAASGVTFNGGSAITVSYNTVGAPSTTGTNASGTWGISVTGNAGSVTNGVYTTGDQSVAGVKTFSGARTQISGTTTAMLELHVPGTAARGFYLTNDNFTRFATTNGAGSASTVLFFVDSVGNFTAAADVTAYSDERLKQNWRDLDGQFLSDLAGVKVGIYDRKDRGITQVGVSAQSLQAILPQAVTEGADGYLTVAYGNAALAACVMLAREVQALKAKVGV